MTPFHSKHSESIVGTLSSFDRIVFKGHLRALGWGGAIESLLASRGMLIKDFAKLAKGLSDEIVEASKQMAEREGRPYLYLPSGGDKDRLAQQIAERDGIEQGLVTVLSCVEAAQSFRVASGKDRPKIVNARRKCLCLYFYFIDEEAGWIHVRLQSWLPFPVQICLNGHNWLKRKFEAEGIGYQQLENSFLSIDDWERAQELADEFHRFRWPTWLSKWARRINPHFGRLSGICRKMSYYWVCDQCEYATDIVFTSRRTLAPLYTELIHHGMLHFGAKDVMGFLGKKLNGRFQGELISDLKERWFGRRIKHRAKRNWIKMYDKQGIVLRIETVINDPSEFKVRRKGKRQGEVVTGWFPLCKGVGYLYRYREVSLAANRRYLQALSVVDDPRRARELVRESTRRCKRNGRSYAGFNPASQQDRQLFRAVLAGGQALGGFCNEDIRTVLYGKAKKPKKETKRLRARVSRTLKRLHVHRLIGKVPRSRKWRVTQRGNMMMSMFITCHDLDYTSELIKAAA